VAAALMPEVKLVQAAGGTVELRRAGKGPVLLVLHGELGVPGWLDAHAALAAQFDVVMPSLAGFGASTRPDWIMGVHDLAAWVSWLARDLDLGRVHLLGTSLGAWAAAELAVVAPQMIERLVLVSPMGIKPDHGQIFDYFLESARTGIRRAFHRPDEAQAFQRHYAAEWNADEAELAEQHREMTCRLAWKPYMHSLTLRHFLPSISVPTLVVAGREDTITPLDCAQIYQRGIPGAQLAVIENCGHMPEMEKAAEFSEIVGAFLSRG